MGSALWSQQLLLINLIIPFVGLTLWVVVGGKYSARSCVHRYNIWLCLPAAGKYAHSYAGYRLLGAQRVSENRMCSAISNKQSNPRRGNYKHFCVLVIEF